MSKLKTSLIFILLLLVALWIFAPDSEGEELVLDIQYVEVDSVEQITSINDSLVAPYVYSGVEDLKRLPVDRSKKAFVNAVLPAILVTKYQIKQKQKKLGQLIHKEEWSKADSVLYQAMVEQYDEENLEALIIKMTPHPTSIALAQAAVESGWGSSRFFRQANNLFGIWSYNRNEPRIPAKFARTDQSVYLKKYENIKESIEDYFTLMASGSAYQSFRKALLEPQQDPFKLVNHLQYYSERRMAYVNQLKTIIRQNNFTKYDQYKIDPAYLVEKDELKKAE